MRTFIVAGVPVVLPSQTPVLQPVVPVPVVGA